MVSTSGSAVNRLEANVTRGLQSLIVVEPSDSTHPPQRHPDYHIRYTLSNYTCRRSANPWHPLSAPGEARSE